MSTRSSPASDDAVIVSISSWEIECCAPPPAVGEMTSWSLQLFPTVESEPHWLPPANTSLEWQVEAWPNLDGPHRMLSRGGIVALLAAEQPDTPWVRRPFQLPDPGRRRVQGVLQAGRHGGRGQVWAAFPSTTALVGSVRVITVTGWEPDENGNRCPAPGAYFLTSCARSPVSFAHLGGSHDGSVGEQTGLLVRLR